MIYRLEKDSFTLIVSQKEQDALLVLFRTMGKKFKSNKFRNILLSQFLVDHDFEWHGPWSLVRTGDLLFVDPREYLDVNRYVEYDLCFKDDVIKRIARPIVWSFVHEGFSEITVQEELMANGEAKFIETYCHKHALGTELAGSHETVLCIP